MSVQDPLGDFSGRLRAALAKLTLSEREDILDEIRAHVRDRVFRSGISVSEALARLGTPEELAHDYVAGALVSRASHGFSPWLVLRASWAWAMTGAHGFAAFCVAVLGYTLGFGLILCGILKPLFPNHVGLWIGPGVFNFGFYPDHAGLQGVREILGPWFTQVSITLGALVWIATTVGTRTILPRLKHWSARALHPVESH